ncbi:hypothetical protein [Spirosoma litoris]
MARTRKIFIPWYTETVNPAIEGTVIGPTLYWLYETDGDCAAIRAQFNAQKTNLTSLTAQSVAVRPDSVLGYQEVDCTGTPVDPIEGGSYNLGPTDQLIESGDDGAEQSNDSLNP